MLNKNMSQFITKLLVLLLISVLSTSIFGALSQRTALGANYEYVTTESLSLRTGMSSSYSRIEMIPEDEIVEVISTSQDQGWAYVEWNGKKGYVLTMYLELKDVEGRQPKTTPSSNASVLPSTSSGYRMYLNQEANVRISPQYGATTLYSLASGTDLLIIDRSGEYFKVYYNGSYGYVHEEYLSDYNESAIKKVPESGTKIVSSEAVLSSNPKSGSLRSDGYHMLTNTIVNVRSGPAMSHGAKFLLDNNQDVLVINRSGEYFEIYVNGEYGYIHQDYLSDYGENAVKPSESLVSAPVGTTSILETGSFRSDGYHMYVAESANIRISPQYGATPLYNVTSGTDLLIIDRSYEYLKVYYNGSYGYIHQDYLRDYSPSNEKTSSSSNNAVTAQGVGKSTSPVALSDKVSIDEMGSYSHKNITVSGTVWTKSVSKVSVYLNGYLLDSAKLNGRTYTYTIPSNVTLPGNNKVRIQAKTDEGTLYQEENFTVTKTPVIVLDTGHGGADPGALGYLNDSVLYEKDYNYKVMQYLKGYLESYGFNIVLTRDGDYYVENSTRADIANANNADLMFSLHHNAGSTTARGGLSIYPSVKYNPTSQASFTESKDLASKLEAAYLKAGMNYRGSYKDIDISGHTLYIMRNVETRTVLTEMGFISNAQDAKMITDAGFQKLLAKYMADEIYKYFYGR